MVSLVLEQGTHGLLFYITCSVVLFTVRDEVTDSDILKTQYLTESLMSYSESIDFCLSVDISCLSSHFYAEVIYF